MESTYFDLIDFQVTRVEERTNHFNDTTNEFTFYYVKIRVFEGKYGFVHAKVQPRHVVNHTNRISKA
jgi:hypothetical protein